MPGLSVTPRVLTGSIARQAVPGGGKMVVTSRMINCTPTSSQIQVQREKATAYFLAGPAKILLPFSVYPIG